MTPRRILVTRLRFLGDIVLCTPLLQTLRERFPEASIEFLGCPPHVDVLVGHPAVDRIHRLSASAGFGEMLEMARALRGRRFDVAVDLFGNPRSALLVAATGARMRVGSQRGVRSHLYTHRRARPEGDRSAIRHHLDKLVPLLAERPESRPPRLYVSEERWKELLRWLVARDPEVEVRVVEPPAQPGLARRVAAGTGASPLPPTDVRGLLAWLAESELYVGNDGGILHAAVALGRPTLGLFGPTEPDIWFPYESWGPYRVLHRCDPPAEDPDGRPASRLRSLPTEEVLVALAELLDRGEATSHA